MNKKIGIILGGLALLLVVTGVVVYTAGFSQKPVTKVEEFLDESLPPVDSAIAVDLTKSKVKDNTLVLTVTGLESKYRTLAYEISYETQGVVQGVTSQPLDLSGKDTFVRDDIYLGTCSGKVCKPHVGVKKVSVVIEFTDSTGQKTQFSKDYDL